MQTYILTELKQNNDTIPITIMGNIFITMKSHKITIYVYINATNPRHSKANDLVRDDGNR